jgi:hypothetical protein
MPQLSEWLQIMLAEIARKQDEARRANEEPIKEEQTREEPLRKHDSAQPPTQQKNLSTSTHV